MPQVPFFKVTDYIFQRAKLLQTGNNIQNRKTYMHVSKEKRGSMGPAEPL